MNDFTWSLVLYFHNLCFSMAFFWACTWMWVCMYTVLCRCFEFHGFPKSRFHVKFSEHLVYLSSLLVKHKAEGALEIQFAKLYPLLHWVHQLHYAVANIINTSELLCFWAGLIAAWLNPHRSRSLWAVFVKSGQWWLFVESKSQILRPGGLAGCFRISLTEKTCATMTFCWKWLRRLQSFSHFQFSELQRQKKTFYTFFLTDMPTITEILATEMKHTVVYVNHFFSVYVFFNSEVYENKAVTTIYSKGFSYLKTGTYHCPPALPWEACQIVWIRTKHRNESHWLQLW